MPRANRARWLIWDVASTTFEIMKTRYFIPLALALLGCSSTAPRTTTLTAEQAGAVAQRLANEKAQTLFNCQPFRNGQPARFVQGHWTWHRFQAEGQGDLEATVEFDADGAEPKVRVVLLDSRSSPKPPPP
jgi:hypothetical protein